MGIAKRLDVELEGKSCKTGKRQVDQVEKLKAPQGSFRHKVVLKDSEARCQVFEVTSGFVNRSLVCELKAVQNLGEGKAEECWDL